MVRLTDCARNELKCVEGHKTEIKPKTTTVGGTVGPLS